MKHGFSYLLQGNLIFVKQSVVMDLKRHVVNEG
jgi:hypothetical protein